MHNPRYDHAPRLPLEGPIDLNAIVPGSGPLMLEIGPGRGMFTLDYAERHPDHRVIAMEIRRKWAAVLDERFTQRKLTNARCFAEDAGAVLPRVGPDGCVAMAAVHFPDPWWKKRHAKRLVVQDAFVDDLARVLAPGAVLLVQTDVEERAAQYRERLDAHPALERGYEGEGAAESPFAPSRSNREKRAIEDGLPITRLVYRKRG